MQKNFLSYDSAYDSAGDSVWRTQESMHPDNFVIFIVNTLNIKKRFC